MNGAKWKARYLSLFASRKKALGVIIAWLLITIILGAIAPSAKPLTVNGGEGHVQNAVPSAKAQEQLAKHFPSGNGLTALLVFYRDQPLGPGDEAALLKVSQWLESKEAPAAIPGVAPYAKLSEAERHRQASKDGTTTLLSISLSPNLDSDTIDETLKLVRNKVEAIMTSAETESLSKSQSQSQSQSQSGAMQFAITGPAGIAADTIELFRNADVVLMLATVVILLVLLLVIYRSPLLAILPLLIAGVAYAITDKLIGLGAHWGWFTVEKQALSIMMILLFAVVTDYCLFVYGRFREAVCEGIETQSRYAAMSRTMRSVAEPIMFSGSTVMVAMLALLAAVFRPYHSFAAVFAVTVIVMLLAGLTLVPAVFVVAGGRLLKRGMASRTALEKPEIHAESASYAKNASFAKRPPIWSRIANFVVRRPALAAIPMLLILALGAVGTAGIRYSFNLLQSFPSDTSSRIGYEQLERSYPPGRLAPVEAILVASEPMADGGAEGQAITRLSKLLSEQAGLAVGDKLNHGTGAVDNENIGGNGSFEAASNRLAFRQQLLMEGSPYAQKSLNTIERLRANGPKLIAESGLDTSRYTLYFAGQTALQTDVRAMNTQDTFVLIVLITALLAVMLAWQARSARLALLMLGTILLSYAGTLGLTWLVLHFGFGFEAISYRIPVYAFVFLVALGVDYNIMLVSRIREEAEQMPWAKAVQRGLAQTGGVISSAGLLLAATFGVLATQPLQELYLFGIIMAVGVLIDTFLVRGMLLPALLLLLGGRSRNRGMPYWGESTGKERIGQKNLP
ncbi:MMPL family transporter [Paenibacillus sp. MMS18-CY102]|uniref:MMPL family transporter n=1 Tax=Paenibacillus sp. MMS18-CY102 TaxID=2682849 RepID=UPI0013665169|nr:MMPL family transporter [Paenibacillus sp. MMS18-CY102]